MTIREERSAGDPYRLAYLTSVEALIARKRREADACRAERARAILADPASARAELSETFGWPLFGERPVTPTATSSYIGETAYGADAYRMQFEVFPGFLFYGILFLHRGKVRPLAVSQHGGLGTPELCSGLCGTSDNYNDMTKRIFERGFHVFAPQMLLWDLGDYPVRGGRSETETGAMRASIDRELKQLGASIVSLELYCLFRALDYFDTRDDVRPGGYAMVGLSYGGFYTSAAAALDERIKSSVSCGFFNDRYRYDGWHDLTWKNAANLFFDAEWALMTYPRKIVYQIGKNDGLFDCESGKKEYERACALGPADFGGSVRLEVFDGIHEFSKDDAALDALRADFGL